MNKKNYAQPSCRFLVVRFKESLLKVSTGETFQPGVNYSGSWDDEDDEE
ncbi:MAG: hypothetical protein IJS62_03235 [Bacteroidales bacterium]|nr:hypothetical protein [Bacteroidales bacterium]MBR0298872.1 hypothetical protein [Bacteroidales bacterium]